MNSVVNSGKLRPARSNNPLGFFELVQRHRLELDLEYFHGLHYTTVARRRLGITPVVSLSQRRSMRALIAGKPPRNRRGECPQMVQNCLARPALGG